MFNDTSILLFCVALLPVLSQQLWKVRTREQIAESLFSERNSSAVNTLSPILGHENIYQTLLVESAVFFPRKVFGILNVSQYDMFIA